jgi:hypothetical protein
MTDDASLTDFFDDSASDESEDDAGSETSERAGDTGTDGEPTAEGANDDVAGDDTATGGSDDLSSDHSAAGTDPETVDGRVPPATVEPATVTASWSPDGAACDDCGSVVPYRWEGDGGLVCPDCKEW